MLPNAVTLAALFSGFYAVVMAMNGRFEVACLAVLCAAVGYGYGARLSQHLRADTVICWALVISLPATLPLGLLSWPQAPVPASAWAAFGYVAVFSMWLGFFAWYRGLALGGTVRVSQVQLVQPFLSLLAAVPLLGEHLDAATVAFSLAVIATVFLGKKMPAHRSNRIQRTGEKP